MVVFKIIIIPTPTSIVAETSWFELMQLHNMQFVVSLSEHLLSRVLLSWSNNDRGVLLAPTYILRIVS